MFKFELPMNLLKPALYFLLVLLVGSRTIARVILEETAEEDHYWKEYDGTVPDDALPGGRDKDGKMIYIGQAFYDDETLVPGEVDATKKTLFYTMNKEQQTTTRDIKILCVHNPGHYEWIHTNSTNVRFLTMKQLVPGGFFSGYPHLIGRTEWEDRVVIGKILLDKADDWFAFDADGKAHYVKTNFQILCVHTPGRYEWIHTNSTNMKFLTMKQLLLGGFLNNFPYLIGRTEWEGRVIVGKIDLLYNEYWLTFVADENPHRIQKDFEVLSYNPRLPITVISKSGSLECGDKVYNIYFN